MLKIAALTMPCVGRMPFGAFSRRPRASPPPTRSLDTSVESRAAAAPWPGLLELRRQAEDERFAAWRPDELHPDRHSRRIDAQRQRDRGLAGAVVGVGEADEVHVLISGRLQLGAKRVERRHCARQRRGHEHVVRVPEAHHDAAVRSNRIDRANVVDRSQLLREREAQDVERFELAFVGDRQRAEPGNHDELHGCAEWLRVRAAFGDAMAEALEQPGHLSHASGHLFLDLRADRKSTRLNSSHLVISYAVFCLKKKKKQPDKTHLVNNYNYAEIIHL